MIQFGKENKQIDAMPFLMQATTAIENTLHLIIALPLIEDETKQASNNPNVNEILKGYPSIHPNENNRYEIVFEDTILHMIRNESYARWEDEAVSYGQYFVIYEKSRLLQNLSLFVDTDLISDMTGKAYKHYAIHSQHQIIDVITSYEPSIRKMK